MKKLTLLFLLIAGLLIGVTSCNDDEDPVAEPDITPPSGVTAVTAGGEVSLDFTLAIPGGYESATASATGGTATVSSEPAAGATNGTVTVTFTANASPGTGTVTLTVNDNANNSETQTAAINISPSAVPEISGVPPAATITAGNTLGPVSVALEAEDGLGSLVITADGTELVNETYSGETTATYEFSYESEIAEGGSQYTVVFTVADSDGDEASMTHILTIEELDVLFEAIDATEERGPDEDNTTTYPQKQVTGIINTDYTFSNDSVWVLNGRVIVDGGATLKIEPGTIIKGTPGQGALSSVLLVASGSRIEAIGTMDDPIVFTSIEDNINVKGLAYYDGTSIIQNGDGYTSTLDVNVDIGKWGGLIILGNAPISADAATTVIEGIPPSVPQAVYGGTNDSHDGGTIQYVSIRFTGTQLGPGNELQGLTLGGVGAGTTIDNVESVASADDGIEIFGGTVNITNFIVWGQEDDGYDADQAWTGTVDNFVYLGTNATADHAFELDGPEGASKGIGNFVNGTVWGANSSGMIDFRDDAEYSLDSIFFFMFGSGADIELDAGDNDDETENSDNYLIDETITLTALQFRENANATLAEIMDDKLPATAANSDTKFADATNENSVIGDSEMPTVGADVSGMGWSYAAKTFTGWSVVQSVGQ